MRDVMITTFDNPYNPFDDFRRWLAYDQEKGYNSLSYLARVAKTSIELPEEDNIISIEQAIDEICRINNYSVYDKVVKE